MGTKTRASVLNSEINLPSPACTRDITGGLYLARLSILGISFVAFLTNTNVEITIITITHPKPIAIYLKTFLKVRFSIFSDMSSVLSIR